MLFYWLMLPSSSLNVTSHQSFSLLCQKVGIQDRSLCPVSVHVILTFFHLANIVFLCILKICFVFNCSLVRFKQQKLVGLGQKKKTLNTLCDAGLKVTGSEDIFNPYNQWI